MPALELIQEIERRGSQNSDGEKDDDLIEVESENKEHTKNENKGGSESSKLTATKMLPRRSSISGKQSHDPLQICIQVTKRNSE